MKKRFMAVAIIFGLTLSCILPVNITVAAETLEKYEVAPVLAIGMKLEDFEEIQGKGEYKYDTNDNGKILTGVTYKLDWSNLLGIQGSLETEYVLSRAGNDNIITEIVLRFPEKVDKVQLIDELKMTLGTPTEEEKGSVKWYKEGILYELEEIGKNIIMNMKIEKFNGKKYNLSEDMIVLGKYLADVSGDGKKEKITLVGKRFDEDSIYMDDIKLLVESEGDGYVINLSEEGGGYLPGIQLHDFTGDKIPEVMIAVPTGGSGGIIDYYIYSLKHNKPVKIFDSAKNSVKIEGVFAENYKGKIYIKDAKGVYEITALVDMKEKKDIYDELGIYKNGKLINDMYHELMANTLYGLIKAVDVDDDGVMELEAYQSVKGSCNADHVADVITVWKWQDGEWNIKRIAVEK